MRSSGCPRWLDHPYRGLIFRSPSLHGRPRRRYVTRLDPRSARSLRIKIRRSSNGRLAQPNHRSTCVPSDGTARAVGFPTGAQVAGVIEDARAIGWSIDTGVRAVPAGRKTSRAHPGIRSWAVHLRSPAWKTRPSPTSVTTKSGRPIPHFPSARGNWLAPASPGSSIVCTC